MEFNSSIFSAMLTQWGAEPRTYPIVPDRREAILEAVRTALDQCDAVLLNAGSSAGREDHSAAVIREVGQVLYHGIAMKPGKPAILGYRGKKPILGVPGYPVSGILVLTELLRPLLEDWYRTAPQGEPCQEAVLSRAVVSGLKYQEFVRVRLGRVGGKLMASPLSRGSGVVSSFMRADGILTVPQGVEGYEAGSRVAVRLLRPAHELENTLVSIGSHDPLLDEAADLLHLADPSLCMSSTHVGSMGGIMAVRRGGDPHRRGPPAGRGGRKLQRRLYPEVFPQRRRPPGGVRGPDPGSHAAPRRGCWRCWGAGPSGSAWRSWGATGWTRAGAAGPPGRWSTAPGCGRTRCGR